jgi:hypothetical protein
VRPEGPAIEVTTRADGTSARWIGTLTCGHRWTCPVCAQKLIAKRRMQILDALTAGRKAEPSRAWSMLTLTLRHNARLPLSTLLRGLRKAWRRCRQSGAIQRICKTRVAASVRAVEVTDGRNGWHPHLHVLVLTSEWSIAERERLSDKWCEMVTRELGVECTPTTEHGTHWSRTVDDKYLAKLGLETTGASKKNAAWSHAQMAKERYEVARRVFSREERARIYEDGDRSRARFREYETATKGCRAIELDDRAAALARKGEALRLADDETLVREDQGERAPSYEVDMTAIIDTLAGPLSMMRALRFLERSDRCVFAEVLDVAARAPPHGAGVAVRSWLEEQTALRFATWQ